MHCWSTFLRFSGNCKHTYSVLLLDHSTGNAGIRLDNKTFCDSIQDIIKTMIHYLKNKVGVVDFANAQGPEGPAGFEILPLRGLL